MYAYVYLFQFNLSNINNLKILNVVYNTNIPIYLSFYLLFFRSQLEPSSYKLQHSILRMTIQNKDKNLFIGVMWRFYGMCLPNGLM